MPDSDVLSIEITKDIGWGFDFDDLLSRLKGWKGKRIEVPINSYGGFVFEGIAIYNTLLGRSESVWTKVIGYAMSMGSVIAMSGDRRYMPAEGYLMLHNPWSIAIGDHNDMYAEGDLLHLLTSDLAAIYSRASGLEHERLMELMDKETWLNGSQALELGLVTDLTRGAKFKAHFSKEELDAYKNIPRSLLNKKSYSMDFMAKLNQGLKGLVSILEEENAKGETKTPKEAPKAETPPKEDKGAPPPKPPEVKNKGEEKEASAFEQQILDSLQNIGTSINSFDERLKDVEGDVGSFKKAEGDLSTTIAQLKAASGKLAGGNTLPLDETEPEKKFKRKAGEIIEPGNESEH